MSNPDQFSGFRYDPAWYDRPDIQGVEAQRPYDLNREILTRIPKDGIMADIGCGTGRKIIPLAPLINRIVGIDNDRNVLVKLSGKISEEKISNITLAEADGAKVLPLPNESADMVTFMLSLYNPQEAHRVLKPGGWAIAEIVGERDKSNIKNLFGNNSEGKPRGYKMEKREGQISSDLLVAFAAAGFSETKVEEWKWKTWYTPEGLIALCKAAKTVADFDEIKDKPILDTISQQLMTENGIETEQHRVVLIARK